MNINYIYIYIYIPYQGSKYGFFGYKLFTVKVGIHDVCTKACWLNIIILYYIYYIYYTILYLAKCLLYEVNQIFNPSIQTRSKLYMVFFLKKSYTWYNFVKKNADPKTHIHLAHFSSGDGLDLCLAFVVFQAFTCCDL